MNPYFEGLLKARKDALASLNAALTIVAPIVELVNSLNREISLEYLRCVSGTSGASGASDASNVVPPAAAPVRVLQATASLPIPSEFKRNPPSTAGERAKATAEPIAAPTAAETTTTTADRIDSASDATGSREQDASPAPLGIKEELAELSDQDDLPLYQRYVQQASKKTATASEAPTRSNGRARKRAFGPDRPRSRIDTFQEQLGINQFEKLFREDARTRKAGQKTKQGVGGGARDKAAPRSPKKLSAAREKIPILRLDKVAAEFHEQNEPKSYKSDSDIVLDDEDVKFEDQKNSSCEGAARTRAVVRRTDDEVIIL